MAVVRTSDPWGEKSSLENMTKQAGGAVKKAVTNTVKAVVSDVKDSLGVETNTSGPQGQQVKQVTQVNQVSQEDQARSEQEKQKVLNETRRNLQKLNQEIMQVRRERMQKKQQEDKKEEKKKEDKKVEEQKKNAEPLWKRFVRKGGSGEGIKKQGF